MANENARMRRKNPTISEGLLWSILRGSQLSGLRFRREHPVGPWILDFACVSRMLAIEVDGGYHDSNVEQDLARQADIENRGWTVIRFSSDQVEQDAEAVAREVVKALGVEYIFRKRLRHGSGMNSDTHYGDNPKG
jgi:very-short-patch-repair endonuclease